MEKNQKKESKLKKFISENAEEIQALSLGLGVILVPLIFLGIMSNIENKRKYKFLEKALEKGTKIIEIKPNGEVSNSVK